jgi:hypothetical protein
MAGKAFFMKRLNDHVQYLKKVDAAVKGDSDFEGTAHETCELGKWLYNEGPQEVAAMTDGRAQEVFDSLLEPHQRFHDLGKKALDQKQTGDGAAVRAAVTEMHIVSTIITNKLLELDSMK